MSVNRRLITSFLGLALTAAWASATVLSFDIAGATDGSFVPQDYGDNVTSNTMGAYSYDLGGGFTPNVTVQYFGDPANSQQDVNFWSTGYSNLNNVMEYEPDGASSFGIRFDCTNGDNVDLEVFRVGNFGAEVTVQNITAVDGLGNLLWQSGSFTLPANTGSYVPFFTSDAEAPTVILTVDLTGLGSNSDNIGLDHIRFAQRPVPEPLTLATLGIGLVALKRRARRK